MTYQTVGRRSRYNTDPEYRAKRLKQAAAYRARNPHVYAAYQKADRASNPEKWRNYDRKAKGLPEPRYPAPEHCEICGLRSDISLCLDHEHFTGMFRGWLCKNCNVGLGHFRDNPEALEKAAKYLRDRA